MCSLTECYSLYHVCVVEYRYVSTYICLHPIQHFVAGKFMWESPFCGCNFLVFVNTALHNI